MTNDAKVNWLGLAQSIGTAIVSFYATESADGVIDWTHPMLYVGLSIAVLMAVKAYFTNKADEPKPTA